MKFYLKKCRIISEEPRLFRSYDKTDLNVGGVLTYFLEFRATPLLVFRFLGITEIFGLRPK